MIFGIPDVKDEQASGAYAEHGITQEAVRAVKAAVPELIVMTDVCNCEYTSHGHCGVMKDGVLQNDETLGNLVKQTLVHAEAGADIIETNTFSCTRVAMADYGMESLAAELAEAGARIARTLCDEFEARDGRPRYVAGVLGPTNRSAGISPKVEDAGFRNITFDDLVHDYAENARALIAGGADLLLIETIFDTLNAKAAVFAVEQVFLEDGVRFPVMISGTITDQSGRTLTGQTTEAFFNSLAHARPWSIGLNCALGARDLRGYIQELARVAPCRISVHPNAGLPNEMGGYDETPAFTSGVEVYCLVEEESRRPAALRMVQALRDAGATAVHMRISSPPVTHPCFYGIDTDTQAQLIAARLTLDEIAAMKPDRLVLSPGPCSPAEAGICVPALQRFTGQLPILGVCLGHQSIGAALGGKVIRAPEPMHGKLSTIRHRAKGLFAGLPDRFEVTRYHSLIVERSSLPAELEVTARTADGLIMGVRHRTLAVEGVQFHPESILTEGGHRLIENFLDRAR